MLIDIDSKTKEEVHAHLKKIICKPEWVSLVVVYYQEYIYFVLLLSLLLEVSRQAERVLLQLLCLSA
jgi:hypothetical protein